jgi:hypothetical protein
MGEHWLASFALDCLITGSSCGSFHPPQRWPGVRVA